LSSKKIKWPQDDERHQNEGRDTLLVTEAQSLIDYILSWADWTTLTDEHLEGLRATVEREAREKAHTA